MIANQEESRDQDGKVVRFPLRMSRRQRQWLEEAAELVGQNLTEFILSAAQERAERVVIHRTVIQLSERDTAAVMQSLETPPEPTSEMYHLLGELARRVESRT